jgi:hypothetical protein
LGCCCGEEVLDCQGADRLLLGCFDQVGVDGCQAAFDQEDEGRGGGWGGHNERQVVRRFGCGWGLASGGEEVGELVPLPTVALVEF